MNASNLVEKQSTEKTHKDQESKPLIPHKVAAFVLLGVASLLLWITISTYALGIMSLGFKNVDGTIDKILVRINPVGTDKIANVSYPVDGKILQSTALMPRDRLIKEGEKVDVWYDPGNVKNISLIHEVDYDTVIVYGALGLFALSFGSFMLYRIAHPQSDTTPDRRRTTSGHGEK